MKAASISELKKELIEQPEKRLVELCLELIKYKKENKELLTYLLFESGDKQKFVQEIKQEVDDLYEAINVDLNLYFVKKSVRKILRLVNKYSKYIGEKEVEADLLIYFLKKLKASGIQYEKSKTLHNLFQSQLKKINTLVASLHEDLQYDYFKELSSF
jgi:hypothetical protein